MNINTVIYKRMSFAGHVFDMIRRNKEDRENLRRIRESGHDSVYYSSQLPDMSAEAFEQIRRQTRERERRERQRYIRMIVWILALVVVVQLIFCVLKALLF